MKRSKLRQRAIAAGYRSGLEEDLAKELEDKGVAYEYETLTIKYAVNEVRK